MPCEYGKRSRIIIRLFLGAIFLCSKEVGIYLFGTGFKVNINFHDMVDQPAGQKIF